MDSIEKIDKFLFLLIHTEASQKWLDPIMLAFRSQYTWIPLYLFICFYCIRKTKKHIWLFFFATIFTFALTDIFSAQVLKPFFGRIRPCFVPELQHLVRNIIDCGGKYSFPSSHASNHFGVAMVWYLFFKQNNFTKWKWLFIWAAAIAYAQVYVGKHFPIDVLVGAILGISIGLIVYKTTTYFFSKSHKFGHNYKETLNT